MPGLKCLALTVATALLLPCAARAQSARHAPKPGHTPAAGWPELRELSDRVGAVEAENRWLRQQLEQRIDVGHVGSRRHNGLAGCGSGDPARCSWIDQLSTTCKTRLSWNKGPVRVVPFGYAAADMIGSERAYTLLGGPLFLLPAVPSEIPDDRFTVSGQQTTLGLDLTGPGLWDYQSRAVLAFNFFGDRPVQNNPGVFFLFGYVELRNEEWRFWAGQDGDAIARQNSNSPSWASHKQSGNAGQIRPGFRAERFFAIGENVRTSVYFGLTQQVVLDFIASPQVAGTDNGWPNIEARWEVAIGPDTKGERPLMLALGGLIGETRAVDLTGRPVANVSTTWGVIPEVRMHCGRFGFQGEFFVGEALGTYNAGIGQSLNVATDTPIFAAGGFGELFCDLTDRLTVAVGYGIDDPRDADLAPVQRSRNETYWANAICRWNRQWETRCEISRLKTDYIDASSSSSSMIYQLSVRYNF